ncbi:Equilibrative nucleoside transporter [Phytophthora cactorum]|nr:Equilibrative nucleoside transporter [Phytophthora cactorum]
MDSPTKSEKLVQEDSLEIGRDGMPPEIWEDMVKHEKFIYFSLMFLNGSVLWAYYSCLSAQDFYSGLQMIFGLDKKFSQRTRVHVGYCIFMVMAILIMVFSAINFSSQKTGGILVLVCFGCIGFGNSLSEATYYTFAALFPIEKFTNGVQIGNTCAGILNITVATLLRLAVGGVNQTSSSTKLSFLSVLQSIGNCPDMCHPALPLLGESAVGQIPHGTQRELGQGRTSRESIVGRTLKNLSRIFCIIWMPAIAQFLVFFVSLSVFPGFGCAASRNLFPPYNDEAHDLTSTWYLLPGYHRQLQLRRFHRSYLVYGVRVLRGNHGLGVRVVGAPHRLHPLLLMGVAGTSLYAFPFGSMGALAFNIVLNLLIGISTGLISTVTMGVAPRMLKPEDRESGGAVMVFFLFLGNRHGLDIWLPRQRQRWLGL